MLELKIVMSGKTSSDLELALDIIRRQLGEGYLGGTDSNDSGRYSYDVTGDDEELDECNK